MRPRLVILIALTLAATGLGTMQPALAGSADTCDQPNTPTQVGTNHDDVLLGTPGRDVIYGGGGDDVIKGRGDFDVLCGEEGKDRIVGGGDQDNLSGGRGADRIEGGSNRDYIWGGRSNDAIFGNGGDDYLVGGFWSMELLGTDFLDGGRNDGNGDECWADPADTIVNCEL